ncbi:hypothetical protein BGZ60DRAFT_515419 [Tricladium varicosporioides]|nr:hypothetical protein BGZ60DRAFT_515419 [Hymenoscyphus varicosporioides]
MTSSIQNITIIATPTSPILAHLLHDLSHKPHLNISVLTWETGVKLPVLAEHSHSHAHSHTQNSQNHNHNDSHTNGRANGNGSSKSTKISHIQTNFSKDSLKMILNDAEVIICVLVGPDVRLSSPILEVLPTLEKLKLFIPSEYGLDTCNEKIRELLPPYKLRWEVQEGLRKSGVTWKALYSGITLEEGLKVDGVLSIDSLWASVVVFDHDPELQIPLSSHKYIAQQILSTALDPPKEQEIRKCEFKTTLNNLVSIVEKELDKAVDRYEGDLDGARKEAKERMKMGYFDGGVSLMGKVAVWDQAVNTWDAWENVMGSITSKGDWEKYVKRIVKGVREGGVKGEGCGC